MLSRFSKHMNLIQSLKKLQHSPIQTRRIAEAHVSSYIGSRSSTSRVNFDSQFRNFMSYKGVNSGSSLGSRVFDNSNYLPANYIIRRQYVSNIIRDKKSQITLVYLSVLVCVMVGATYAAVPLYRRFCQATGYGGTVQRRETVEEKIARHAQDGATAPTREIVVQFNADVADGMQWKFTPTQREAGVYFNKIQCFCFEEQLLQPGEQIDMPVFFYIDPEFATDPRCDGINNIILSYTFFKVKE